MTWACQRPVANRRPAGPSRRTVRIICLATARVFPVAVADSLGEENLSMRNILTTTICEFLLICCCHAGAGILTSEALSTNELSLTEALPLGKSRLLELDHVGGFGGLAIEPTPFLELSVVFIEAGNRQLFDSFLDSTNSIAKAMGLVCLSQTDSNAFRVAATKIRAAIHPLTVWTGGCMPLRMTLGELATELQQNPNFLGHTNSYHGFQEFRQRVKKGSVPRNVVTPRRH